MTEETARSFRLSEVAAGLLLWGLLVLCAWLYWPGLGGPAMLDDGVNLRVIYSLQESPEYLRDVVLGNSSGPLGRPVSMLSFGLEQLYGDGTIRGFKRTNLCLHLLAGCLVAWFLHAVMPVLSVHVKPAYWAVIGGGMWLLSPLFVSTTLYIVQRMTQLAALFCLAALVAYIKGRGLVVRRTWQGGGLIGLSLLFAVTAGFSKENGLLTFPLLALTEIVICARATPGSRWQAPVAWVVLVVGAAVGVALFLSGKYEVLLSGYRIRDFTVTERLLTQARVLLDYLVALLLPLRDGLGVYHDDYPVSRGLIDPPVTLVAVASWLVVAFYAARSIVRGTSAIGYGVLFFLAAHSMESSILPLEIYFEHRNYLPAVGLYLSLVFILMRCWEKFPPARTTMVWGLGAWFCLAAMSTGIQAAIWSREVVLLREVLGSHPKSARANASMSAVYARMGAIEQALQYAERSADLKEPIHLRHSVRALALHCMANKPVDGKLLIQLDDRMTEHALIDAGVSEGLQVFVEHANRGECPDTNVRPVLDAFAKKLLTDRPLRAAPRVYGLLAILEHYVGNRPRAEAYLDFWVRREPDSVQAWLIRLTVATIHPSADERARALAELERLGRAGKISREELHDIQMLRQTWSGD